MIDNGSPRINLSKQVKEKAVRDLVSFNEFTLYSERDTDECTGLTFALEFLFCSLGLNESTDDSADSMKDLVVALDETAKELEVDGWQTVRNELPFFDD